MANVTNIENPELYLRSVHTPDYTDGKWIIHDTIESIEDVENISLRYRKVIGVLNKKVVEMSKSEKVTKDAQILEAEKEIQKQTLINEKIQELNIQAAINSLITEGKLNSDGSLKEV